MHVGQKVLLSLLMACLHTIMLNSRQSSGDAHRQTYIYFKERYKPINEFFDGLFRNMLMQVAFIAAIHASLRMDD